ncbi:hypothetical protein Salat_0560300 [Sesamum alatum]|uniref:Uncharacterized protein n=1 Tax=Sesamum alatum TaxID=300844 RepID=A0AAE1YPF7_9LAMI|nr:hypothetical protein Salat_0560300 [Sesamum alatum]
MFSKESEVVPISAPGYCGVGRSLSEPWKPHWLPHLALSPTVPNPNPLIIRDQAASGVEKMQKTETVEAFAMRVASAREELRHLKEFDYVVVIKKAIWRVLLSC